MKTAKRTLAVLLACLMVFGSLGVVGSAKGNSTTTIDPVGGTAATSAHGTVTYGLDIYKDDTKLSDGDLLSPGDVIEVRLCFGTDFYLGLLSSQIYYDSKYFEPYLNGEAYTVTDVANSFATATPFMQMLTDGAPTAVTIDSRTVTLFDTMTPIDKNGVQDFVNKAGNATAVNQWTPLEWRVPDATGKKKANYAVDDAHKDLHYVGLSLKCDGDGGTGGYDIIVPYAPYFSFQLRVKEGADSNGATTSIFVPIDGAKRSNGQTCNRLYATECPNGVYATTKVPTNGQGFDLTNADVDFVIGEAAQHEHSYTLTGWSWATDYSSATATFTCSDSECGDVQTVTDSTIDENVVTPANCTDNKVVTYTASVMFNETEYSTTTDEITIADSALGHDWGDEEVEYIDETYHGVVCGVCDAVKEGTMAEHDYSIDVSVDVQPTEDAPGLKTVQCAGCGNTKQVEIPALLHTHLYEGPTWEWAADGSSATAVFTCVKGDDTQRIAAEDIEEEEVEEAECGKDAVVQYIATVEFNGDEYTDTLEGVSKPGTALAHSYGEPVWAWSDDYTSATVTFTCANCNDTQTPEVTVTPTTVSELTCKSDYVVYYTASVNFNGTDYSVNSPEVTLETSSGHVYNAPVWAWADDCSSATATFTCKEGDDTITLDATQIDETVVTELGCETDKVVTYTATVIFNGEPYSNTSDEITLESATGHTFGDAVWNWEGTASATATITCTKGCGTTKSETDNAPAENVVTPAGCETDKVVTYTATVTIDGTEYTNTTDEITVPDSAAGHEWPASWTYLNEDEHTQKCANCEETRSEAHNYVKNDEESTSATIDAAGEDVFYCSGCGNRKTEVVDKLDHEHQFTTAPTWAWADDNTSATATFKCDFCDETMTLTDSAPVENTVSAADCTNDQVVNYTATVNYNGTDYTSTSDNVTVSGTATGHSWGEPEVVWASDYTSVTATFTCGVCQQTKSVTETVITPVTVEEAACGKNQVVKYTADIEIDGASVTVSSENVTIEGSMLSEHAYGEPVWDWAADYTTATATFTCANCNDTQTESADIDMNIVTELSCTTDYAITYTANVTFNGTSYSDTTDPIVKQAAAGHQWASTATFIDEDTHGILCAVCDAVKEDSVEAHDYSIDVGIVVEATVNNPGTKTVECSVCHNQKDVEYTVEHTHEYGEPTWEWAADGSTATAVFTCTEGDDTQRIPADNILEEEIEEPECGKDGVYQYIATVTFADETYTNTLEGVTKVGSALEHSYGEPEWTWSADGKTATATFTCANCSDKQTVTDNAPAENVVTPAGCETDKVVTYTATVSFGGKDYSATSGEYTIADSATGHSYGEPEWTWSDDGKTATATFTCANCSDKQTATSSNNTENVVTPAGCETDEVVTYTATVNFGGKDYTATSGEYTIADTATGHNYGEPEWTWSEDGKTVTATLTCADCNEKETATPTEAPVETVVSEADCVNDKVVTYTATVTVDGNNYTGTSEQIAVAGTALDHNFGAWTEKDADTHTRTCSRCQLVETAAHTYSEWTVTKEATETEEGEESRSCTLCGRTETRKTDKLPVSELTITATDANGNKTGPAKEIELTIPYARKGRMALQLDASKDGVEYSIDEKGAKSLNVDENGKVTFSRLRLFCCRRNAVITVTDADGNKATCKVYVKLKWWQYIVWFLLFGWIWF